MSTSSRLWWMARNTVHFTVFNRIITLHAHSTRIYMMKAHLFRRKPMSATLTYSTLDCIKFLAHQDIILFTKLDPGLFWLWIVEHDHPISMGAQIDARFQQHKHPVIFAAFVSEQPHVTNRVGSCFLTISFNFRLVIFPSMTLSICSRISFPILHMSTEG